MKNLLKTLCFCLAFALILSVLPGQLAFAEAETEYEEKTYSFSTKDEDEETDLSMTALGEYFTCQAATGDSLVTTAADGVAIADKYAQLYTGIDAADEFFSNPYAVTVNFTSTSNADAGVYVRSIDPTLIQINNQKLGSTHAIWFYEWDWYAEHGGTQGPSSTGGSGVKVSFSGNNVIIGVKCAPEDGSGVMSRSVTFAAPEGFDPAALNPIKITDDTKGKIEVYVCDTLIGTVEYGGTPDIYEDTEATVNSEVEYYKQAVIKGADGTEMLTITDARIAVIDPVVAIGNRNGTTKFSELTFVYTVAKKTATEEPAPTEEPVVTDAPAATDAPADATEAAADATDAPADATKDASAGDDTETKSFNPVPVIIGVCAAVIIAAVVVIILASKKKK